MGESNPPAAAGAGRFATTRWSLVQAAGGGDRDRSGEALAELCASYWEPLYSYARRRGYAAEDARDLTQAFFAKLLAKGDLASADPARGRFRTFLLSCMKNFLAGEWRKQTALKRGGAIQLLSLDFDSAEDSYRREPAHELTPEAVFQRRWALRLLARAVADLEAEYAAAGKAADFAALKGFIDGGEARPYAELSRRLGRSEGALRTAVSRLRARWRKRLRELVAETVRDDAEVEDELRALVAALEAGA